MVHDHLTSGKKMFTIIEGCVRITSVDGSKALIYGTLAQLGEHPLDVRKVIGSNPIRSIFLCL